MHPHPAPCTGGPASRPPSAQSVQTQGCNRPGFGENNGTHRLPIGAGLGAPKQDGDGRGLPPTLVGTCRDRARSVPWPAPSRNTSCPWQAEVEPPWGWVSWAPEEQGPRPPCHEDLGIWGGKPGLGGLQKDLPERRKLGVQGDHPQATCLMASWPQTGPTSEYFGLHVGVLSLLP